jgi:hypothetical protein
MNPLIWGSTSSIESSNQPTSAPSTIGSDHAKVPQSNVKRIGWSRKYTTGNRHSAYTRPERSHNLNFGKGSGHLDAISEAHGFLSTRYNIRELCRQTHYNRRELYLIFVRFKALCALRASQQQSISGSSSHDPSKIRGIDKHTFQHGVSRLSVEDDRFVDRVFAQVDTDSSGQIEFLEYVSVSSIDRCMHVLDLMLSDL